MSWAGQCRWNIAPHDFAVKARKLEEFLEQGKTVSVAVTYDHRPKTWQEQYPKAVEVRRNIFLFFLLQQAYGRE
jgi:translation initiation factor IF-3